MSRPRPPLWLALAALIVLLPLAAAPLRADPVTPPLLRLRAGTLDPLTLPGVAGTGRLEAGTGGFEAGTGGLEADTGRLEAGTGRLEADTGRLEAGTGRLEAGTGGFQTRPYAASDKDGAELYVVQFERPPTPDDRAALQRAGAEIGAYLPDYAYLVRARADALPTLAALPGARWVGDYRPEWRVDSGVWLSARRGDLTPGRGDLTPRPPSLGGKGESRAETEQSGAPPRVGEGTGERSPRPILVETFDGHTARLVATTEQIEQLAGAPNVVWIAPAPGQRRLLNDVARSERIMRVERAWAQGLFGAGQTVAVADSGLDVGDLSRLNPDFAGRVAATLPLSGTAWNDAVGHGTHVAGSIVGNGVQSGSDPASHRYTGSLAGMAPEARLVVQAFHVDPDSGEITGLPDNLADLFGPAYAQGARVHSNSWGGPADDEKNPFGVYGLEARQTDRFTWDHPDFLPVFAAGNDATDGVFNPDDLTNLGDGVVDPDSLSLAATAKNIIAVGASEGLRSEGGYAGYPWLLFGLNGLLGGGGIFLSEPIAGDDMSNNPEGMAAFSSRGPTDDGRVKPDLVAPGTNIVSTRSADPGFQPDLFSWGVYGPNDKYVFNGGTSMATPLVAGSAALVREYLQRQDQAQPSAALVKALLIHTARDLAPGQYGEGATRELQRRPDRSQGWGRVDLGGLFPTAPVNLWVDDRAAGLETGQTASYTSGAQRLTVSDPAFPLRVTLVWTDPPASLAAGRQLVNDLDLVLIAPSGAVYPMGAPDRLNNVEMVEVAQPERGAWRVEVRGANVPLGPQRYALVTSGALSALAAGPTATPDPTRPHHVYLPWVVR